MTLKVFAVRDMKAMAFLQPFYSNSVGAALRAFGDAVNDKTCPFSKHPEDYVLYEIGSFDDNSAGLFPLEVIKMLTCASDLVEIKTPQLSFEELKKDPKYKDSFKDGREVVDIVNGTK